MAMRNASERVKKVFRKVIEENKPVAVAMRESGYTVATSTNPHRLTNSKVWLDMLDKSGLSDENLIKRHEELLGNEEARIRATALDMAYKVKGKYNTGNSVSFNAPVQININPIAPTPPEDTAQ